MNRKYMFGLSPNGQVRVGTALDYPDEYTIEGTKEIWENQNRSFYIDGIWTVYDQLTMDAPVSAKIGDVFTVTITLPENSPDTTVTINVSHENDKIDPIELDVINSSATQDFSFSTDGTYRIGVSSEHHGTTAKDVMIVA